ncbi:MAG TPA: thermostable hemolysin [Burkholderiales bacterium]|nr:thermostable hemolysin [Burkholderiales bacterium]
MITGVQLAQTGVRMVRLRAAKSLLEPVHCAHPARATFEHFIAARFGRAYGAHVTHFLPHLLGVRDGLARWQAAAGYAAAGVQALFLEQYLDGPIEFTLAATLGRPVARAGIVEVGNLAAISAGMARALIPLLARHLHRLGYRWVAFTATRALRNTFYRLGLRPLRLTRADPARLADGGSSWGTYYDHDPVVMAGKISLGLHAGEHA